jgi:hypothetical protein
MEIIMVFRKFSALSLVIGLIFQVFTIAPISAFGVKHRELPQETEQRALKLLSDITGEIQQFKLPENRVTAQTIVMDLMWEHNEREARAISQAAFAELKNLFAGIHDSDVEAMSVKETNEHYYKRQRLADLRREYVLTLARREPQSALAALDALKSKKLEGYDPLEASKLKMEIASAMSKKEPDKTYSLARDQIAKGITFEFIESLKELHKRDSAVAALIGRDIYAFIKTANIRPPFEMGNAENAGTPAKKTAASRSGQPEIEFQIAAFFINAAWELNRRAARDRDKKTLPLLSDTEMKELVDAISNTYLAAKNPAKYSISQVITEISHFSPAQAERIRAKVDAETARILDGVVESTLSYIAREEKNADQMAKEADRAAPDKRDQLYVEAVRKALEENEPEKAKAIAARIRDRKSYGYIFETIESAIPIAKARRGDLTEVRKMLAGLKTNHERVAALTELASALAGKDDNETARKLIREATETLLTERMNQTGFGLYTKIISVYAVIEPEEAFSFAEIAVEQMNPFIDAGIRFDEFYDYGSVESDEIRYDSMNRQLLLHVPNSTDLLKKLALADFERTIRLTNKFVHPEIRLFARLRLIQALLDPEAAEKEKLASEQVRSEDEYH